MITFGHEKLEAYPYSIEFVALVTDIVEGLPRGHRKILDQLERAAISIPLNIAEGSGKTSQADKRRFYAIARGSAMECVAVLDVLLKLKLIDEEVLQRGRTILNSVVGILTSVCRGYKLSRGDGLGPWPRLGL